MCEPIIKHAAPSVPWTKLGADLCHFNKHEYIIVTDYTTKYAVARELRTVAPSYIVVEEHKNIFGELVAPLEM